MQDGRIMVRAVKGVYADGIFPFAFFFFLLFIAGGGLHMYTL